VRYWTKALGVGISKERLAEVVSHVSQPVRLDGLTLDEVEETLTTWKLRGPHGG